MTIPARFTEPADTTVEAPPKAKRKAAVRREVGRSIPRLESHAKVDGSAEYIYHLRLPGMLQGKICRSTVPHGRIVRIDASAALAIEGVHAVITGEDIRTLIPDPYYGPAFHDQPILAIGKVRYVGEPVAVVLAADLHVAEEAADQVVVEYEPLEPVFDEVAATKPGAPIIHDSLRPAGMFPDLQYLKGRSGTNVALDARVLHGDVEKGFAEADQVFENVFRSRKVVHATFEPTVSLAELNGSNGLTIHTSSQSPSYVRAEVSRLLGWPENRVRVRTAFLGGSFGAKLYIKLEALVAACALLVRKPVRIGLTMEEEFYTITKHGATVRIKTGMAKDGRIVAREVETWWNGGAYADIGPRVSQKSGFTAAGPYDIENVSLINYAVYTNDPPAGALRGFGISQIVWAYECQNDIIARSLGIDPLEFRRRNILHDGRPHATGTIMTNAEIDEVLDRLSDRMHWDVLFDHGSGPVRRGRGLAIGFKACIAPTTSVAVVNVYGDGSCCVSCSTVDMGQGSDTAMAQIAAETLGISTETVRVIHPDTDVTPYDMATLGSRSTYHMGNAVRLAAEDARAQLLRIAAATLQTDIEELEYRDGAVISRSGARMTMRGLMLARFGMQAGTVIGMGTFTPPYTKPDPRTGQSPQITPYWMLAGAAAEIEVDTETGRIRVTKLVNVGDVGCAINPAIAKRQLNGAGTMQLGFTLFEEMRFNEGQVINASLADYKIPGMLDVPEDLSAELVEFPHEHGPFGAKGVGETGMFSVSPAIANALCDAIGVRIMELPLTPERVLRAIRESENRPLESE
ncbi:MAG: xanthine dehydrogenase family protein molybdopterin-binding subunit [Acidobacteriia bacterium]|nr:xanthine dehydrogenase family protein molybdopterin-binding subunit [Terriglobia bacterium]